MEENLEKELVDKYPSMYRHYKGDPRKTCMAWGFSCGDGWFSLIDELSDKISKIDKDNQVVVDQVKEKFAGLRFYFHIYGSDDPIKQSDKSLYDEVEKLVSEAEAKSFKTCERCGQPGTLKGKMWVTTMCDPCWELASKGK